MPQTHAGLDRQPITWNPFMLDENGQMMGLRPRLSRGKLATGPVATFKEWIQFSSKPKNEKQVQLAASKGGSDMHYHL